MRGANVTSLDCGKEYSKTMLEDAISSAGTFWLYGGCSLLGLVWLACTMPETANKSLEEVQRLFEK